MSNDVTPDSITIKGVEYVPTSTQPELSGEHQIVIVEGRWNFVGHTQWLENGMLRITGASVIRYWGTTKGLGEIAMGGPTSKTLLDRCGTLTIPAHAVIALMDTNAGKWS